MDLTVCVTMVNLWGRSGDDEFGDDYGEPRVP